MYAVDIAWDGFYGALVIPIGFGVEGINMAHATVQVDVYYIAGSGLGCVGGNLGGPGRTGYGGQADAEEGFCGVLYELSAGKFVEPVEFFVHSLGVMGVIE